MLTSKARRIQESEELTKLGTLLPIDTDLIGTLDKGAILRVALSYFRLQHVMGYSGELKWIINVILHNEHKP